MLDRQHVILSGLLFWFFVTIRLNVAQLLNILADFQGPYRSPRRKLWSWGSNRRGVWALVPPRALGEGGRGISSSESRAWPSYSNTGDTYEPGHPEDKETTMAPGTIFSTLPELNSQKQSSPPPRRRPTDTTATTSHWRRRWEPR